MKGPELRKLMKALGWSAYRVAKELHTTDRTIRRWLNNPGAKTPHAVKLVLQHALQEQSYDKNKRP